MFKINFSFMFMCILSCTSIVGQNIQIQDFYLENAVRAYLDKPTGSINKSDLESLERFVAVGRNITSLKGLEHAKNLIYLRLDNNHIQDIEPLRSLTKLEVLNINGNEIADLEPIRNLVNLKTLSFDRNKISSLVSLNKLEKIKSVTGHFNDISDLSVIKNWKELSYFNMLRCLQN